MFLLPRTYWEVKVTKDKNRGVFATRDISAGTVIGDYLGKIVYEDDEDEYNGVYGVWRNDKETILADPKTEGVQLINHSCAANCALYPYQGHMLYYAIRKIFTGEELSIFYLLEPPEFDEVSYDEACHCGTPICKGAQHATLGFIDIWDDWVRQKQGDYFNKVLAKRGEMLPQLSKYPTSINEIGPYDVLGSLEEAPVIKSETMLPKVSDIKLEISTKGKCLWFKNINLCVYGIMNGLIVSVPESYIQKFGR